MLMQIKYKLLPHQKQFIKSTANTTVLLAGRGAGKSVVASFVALLSLLKQQRIIVFAQTSQALRENLMTEIRRRLDEVIPGQYKYSDSVQKITYKKGVIYGMSYENEDRCRGSTEISTVILDEIALASPTLLSVLTFCMRGTNITPHIYMMSTPKAGGWFNGYIKQNANKIDIIRATTLDNTFITEEQIELMKQSTPDQALLKQELYGEIIDDVTQGALFTKDLFTTNIWNKNDLYAIGIDMSGAGVDYNCICTRRGNEIVDIFKKQICSDKDIVHYVECLIAKYGIDKLCFIAIDSAYGRGVVERLNDKKLPVIEVPFGSSPKLTQYANKRTEMYFNAQKYISQEGLVGFNEELREELEATRYILNNSNRVALIPKADIKLNIGHSPDLADSFVLTFVEDLVSKGNVRLKAHELSRKLFD